MFRSLVLLALLGCSAIVSGVDQQETYQYTGVITAGVLNQRQATSGSVISMTVVVKHSQQKSVVEFQTPTAGALNSPANLDVALRLAKARMAPVGDLEGKANVFFQRERGTVMEVSATQKHWATEIHKSIVNLLRIPPYVGDTEFVNLERNTFRHQSGAASMENLLYYKTEETFAGRCKVSYTMSPDYNGGQWADAPDNVLPQGDYYRLRRFVDFDSCQDPVVMQKTSHGNFSEVHHSQFKDVQSRSAASMYLMRKRDDGHHFDIKGVLQTGSQHNKPFGQDTGTLVVLSKQSLSLMSVTPLSSVATATEALKPVSTWQYQFVSPAGPREDSKVPWVIYQSKPSLSPIYPEYAILGEAQDEARTLERVKQSLEKITDVQLQHVADNSNSFKGTTAGRVTENINNLAKTIRSLSYKAIKSLYTHTNPTLCIRNKRCRVRRQTFLDAAASSGSSANVKAMIEEMRAGDIFHIRAGGLITTLTNNIFDPESMKILMDYVTSLDVWKNGLYQTSQAYLNFARLAHRVCVHGDIKKYSVPHSYLGDKICDRELIEGTFVDHLKDKISGRTDLLGKMVYLQSLGSLGIGSTIPYIKDCILGKVSAELNFRIAAVHSLANNFPEQNQREQVIDALIPIAEDHTQVSDIREVAFMTLVACKPNDTTLQRFAMDTWRDPSYKMRSMVSSTFISLAQSNSEDYSRISNMARKMLPLMKTLNPSLSNSLFFATKEKVQGYNIDVTSSIGWLHRYSSSVSVPHQMFHSLKGDFGGIEVPLLEVFSSMETHGMNNEEERESSITSRSSATITTSTSSRSSATITSRTSSSSSYAPFVFVYASAFNYQSILPVIRGPILKKIADSLRQHNSDAPSEDLWPELMVKYFNPVDIVSILPTPFGIPTIVEVNAPNNWVLDFQHSSPDARETQNITFEGNNKMTLKTQSFVRVLLPWIEKTASAGFDTESTFSVPGKFSATMDSVQRHIITRFTISPHFTGERPVLYYRSKPMSILHELGPFSDITADDTSIVVPSAAVGDSYTRNLQVPMMLVGLKARLSYQGDTDFPLQQSIIIDLIKNPNKLLTLLTTPTAQDCTLAYRLDIGRSETKTISIASVLDIAYMLRRSSLSGRSRSSVQTGQSIAEKLSPHLSPEAMAKLANEHQLGDFLLSLNVNYTAPNVRTRQFQVAISGLRKKQTTESQLKESRVVNVMMKGVPGEDVEQKICVVSDILEETEIRNEHHTSQIFTTSDTVIYSGNKCDDSEKIASLQSTLYLSDDERDNWCKKSPLRCYPVDGAVIRMPWTTDAIYHKLNYELTLLKSPLPLHLRKITNWVDDIANGAVFPHSTRNYIGDINVPENKYIVNVTRKLQSSVIDAWVHSSKKIVEVKSFPVLPVFDWSTPLLGSRIPYHHHSSPSTLHKLIPEPDTQCTIETGIVTTFDGLMYSPRTVHCWEIATQVYNEADSFTILYRQQNLTSRNQIEVQIFVLNLAKIELLSGKQLKLNDEIVTEDSQDIISLSGDIIGNVNKTSDLVIMSVQSKFDVVLTGDDTLTIELSDVYRNLPQGLCGDFNGTKAYDLKSPKGCIYMESEGPLFAASWLEQNRQCTDDQMAELFQEVQRKENQHCLKSLSGDNRGY